jgi:hypothetical protein
MLNLFRFWSFYSKLIPGVKNMMSECLLGTIAGTPLDFFYIGGQHRPEVRVCLVIVRLCVGVTLAWKASYSVGQNLTEDQKGISDD